VSSGWQGDEGVQWRLLHPYTCLGWRVGPRTWLQERAVIAWSLPAGNQQWDPSRPSARAAGTTTQHP